MFAILRSTEISEENMKKLIKECIFKCFASGPSGSSGAAGEWRIAS
jgi:hypothetical protein